MSHSRSAVGFEKRVAEAITRLGKVAAVDVAKEFFPEPTRPQISQVSVAIKRLEAKGVVQRVGKVGRKAFYSVKEVAGLAGQSSVTVLRATPPGIRPIEPLRPEEPIVRPIPAEPVEPPPIEPAILEFEIPKEESIEEVAVEIPVKVEHAAEQPKCEPATIKPARAARCGSMLSHPARRGHIFLARPPHRSYLTAFLALAVIVAGLGVVQFFMPTASVIAPPEEISLRFAAEDDNFFYSVSNQDGGLSNVTVSLLLPPDSNITGTGEAVTEATDEGVRLTWQLAELPAGAIQMFNFTGDATGQAVLYAAGFGTPDQRIVTANATVEIGESQSPYELSIGCTSDIQCGGSNPSDPLNDTFIEKKYPDRNNGRNPLLKVDNEKYNIKRTLVQLPLPPIPQGATINSAILILVKDGSSEGLNVSAHKVTTSWLEEKTTWKKATSTAYWNSTGGDFDATMLDSIIVTQGNNQNVTWNITAAVQQWIDGTSPNYGILLKAAQEGAYSNDKKEEKFRSSQNAGKEPRIEVNYTNVTYDTVPPNVTLVAPANGSSNTSGVMSFVYKVTDASNISVCKLLLNSSVSQTVSSPAKNINQYFTQNMSAGSVNWAVNCTDAYGNTGVSETRQLTILPGFSFQENSTDSSGHHWITEVIIRDSNGTVVYNSTSQGVLTNIPQGVYNITISPQEAGAPVINLTFVDVTVTGATNMQVDFEQLTKDITLLDPSILYNYLFSLDLGLNVKFDHIEYTRIAEGPNLYKCRWFDFDSRQCLGQWVKIRSDLVPGDVYVQVLRAASDPAFGEGSDKFVLTNITIGGLFSDWDAVLDNAAQVTTDGVSGINDLDTVGNAARDLTKSAFTWNEMYLFMYFRRFASPGPGITMVAYIDVNSDGLLNQSIDRVARFHWTSNGDYDFNLGHYNASNGVADPLTGDGVDEPGNFINNTLIEQNIHGGSNDDLELEVRLNWTLLNVTPGTPLKFHISSARGDASILPAQIEDNMNVSDSMLSDVDISPDRSGGAKAGAWIAYNHTVLNKGNIADTFDITAASSAKFNFTMSYANGTALVDTDGDSQKDVGRLAPGSNVTITVNITVNATAPVGTTDFTNVKAMASLSVVSDSVLDTTTVGNLAVFPPRFGRIANNTVISYNHTIRNNLASSPVVDVNATNSHGWSITLYYANGTQLTDTDGNGRPDAGNLSAGSEVNITVKVNVPNVALGTMDTTYVMANSSVNPLTDSGQVKDTTTVALRVEVEPDHADVAGIGSYVFYEHDIYNNGNISDTIDILKSSSMGWAVQLFKADKVTPLVDTNGNSTPDSGLLEGSGGSAKIVAKISVPMTATEGQKDITTITGVSAFNSSYRDIATDNTTAEILVIYNDSARTFKDTNFIINETVYAKAFGLSFANVRFVWVDGNATVVRTSPNIPVDADGQATDQFTTNTSHAPGNWTLVLTRTTGREITRTNFLVIEINPPQVTNVTPAAGSAFNTSMIVKITANVTDDTEVDRVFARVRLPNTTILDVAMNNSIGGAYYSGNFTATDLAGVYNVTIIANDTYGNVNGTETTWFNVNPPTLIAISLVNNMVDFGNIAADATNSTSDGSPLPFRIRNDGTVKVNITVSSTTLWSSEANPTPNYRFAANTTPEEGLAYNGACSLTSFTNAPSVATLFFCFLDFVDGGDEAELEVNVTVPAAESDGNKNSTVTFIASQA
jgi:hypothetical protein